MTTKPDIDTLIANLTPPDGRNPEHDFAQLAHAFLKKAHNGGFEPYLAEGGDVLTNDICRMLGLQETADRQTEAYWAERVNNEAYANALWDALPDYLAWALDAAAHHRTTERTS